MKMAIYMKCYIDAVDSVSAFCLHQDFILTKLNEIMSRGERRNEGDTQTPKRTTPQPPHWSPQYSVRICSVSFLYSAWAHYKAKCSKSGVEHLNSPSYLKLLGFTTHKHGVLFIQQEQEEQELCYADVQIYSSFVLSPPSSTKLIHVPSITAALSCSVVGSSYTACTPFFPGSETPKAAE